MGAVAMADPVRSRRTRRSRLDAWQVAVVVLLVLLAVAVTGWITAEQRVAPPVGTVAAQPVASGPLSSQVLNASRIFTTDVGAYLAVKPPTVVSDAAETRFVSQIQGHVSQIYNKFHIWNFWYSAAVARHYTQFNGAAEIAYRYALATWITDQSSALGDRYHCFDSVPYNGGQSKVLPCWHTELQNNSGQWAQDVSALNAAWANVPVAQRANLPPVPVGS